MEFPHYIPGLVWPFLHGPELQTITAAFAQAALTMGICGCGPGLIHLFICRGTHNET